jgi:CheY-like chemotaxis protein
MPEIDGFEVVKAIHEHPETARIPILVVTAKQITAEDRARLQGYVASIIDRVELDRDRFAAEVRRATADRTLVS